MAGLWDIQRQTNGSTDQRTNEGDYYGPHWVNPGSKVLKNLLACLSNWEDTFVPHNSKTSMKSKNKKIQKDIFSQKQAYLDKVLQPLHWKYAQSTFILDI